MSLCLPDNTETPEFFAFIQPLRYKNKMYLGGINTPIGFNSQGYFLYIGPPGKDLTAAGVSLKTENLQYKIERAEKVCRGEKVFYIWAIIREMTGVD